MGVVRKGLDLGVVRFTSFVLAYFLGFCWGVKPVAGWAECEVEMGDEWFDLLEGGAVSVRRWALLEF